MTGRGLRGRRAGFAVIAMTTLVLLVFGMLIVLGPSSMGPPAPDGVLLLSGAGVLGIVIGLGWMIRIYRADPEAHDSFFRSRKF